MINAVFTGAMLGLGIGLLCMAVVVAVVDWQQTLLMLPALGGFVLGYFGVRSGRDE